MAQTRRQPGEVETVDPMVEGGEPTEGVTTMAGMFAPAQVVDQVQEAPLPFGDDEPQWIIRPLEDIEDMTVGVTDIHFAFKAGTRYRVPQRIAEILYNRDRLMEVPYEYDEATMARRR